MSLPPFPAEYLSLSDNELATQFWVWWIVYHLEQRGIPMDCVTPELMEEIQNLRLATLSLDTDDEAMSSLEKILRLLATEILDNRIRAARMIRDYFNRRTSHVAALDEAQTGRRKQRERARKLREDAASREIRLAVELRPDISAPQLLDEFRQRAAVEDEVIQEVTDKDIFVVPKSGGDAKPIKITSLPDRLSRAKKKLKKLKSH